MAGGDARRRPVLGATGIALVVLVSTALAVHVAYGGASGQRSSSSACAERVLSDWSDGRIDGAYASDCYLAALQILPEDVRAYSSAADDISRALQARTSQSASTGASSTRRLTNVEAVDITTDSSRTLRRPPAPVLAIVGCAILLGIAGSAAFVHRRLRHDR
jgi:hypothetical protein